MQYIKVGVMKKWSGWLNLGLFEANIWKDCHPTDKCKPLFFLLTAT